MTTAARRLKELRDRLGYSQEGIAASVGMTQVSWDRWESSPPQALAQLARIAVQYGISADYLLGITDDPLPQGRADKLPHLSVEMIQTMRGLSRVSAERLLAIAAALVAFDEDQRQRVAVRRRWLSQLAQRIGEDNAKEIEENLAEAVTTGDTLPLIETLDRLYPDYTEDRAK